MKIHRPRAASVLSVLAAVGGLSSAAHATWSIVLVDTRTGEVLVGSATCLTGLDLKARTPVVLVGVGGATAQSASDTTQQNRTFVRDRIDAGQPADAIFAQLQAFDVNFSSRQYGIVPVGGVPGTFTGTDANPWAGGQIGSANYSYAAQTGAIAYAVQGNILTGANVVADAVAAIINTNGDMPARLMAGMEAAAAGGGDSRCSCTFNGCPDPAAKTADIGYMISARAGDPDGTHGVYRSGFVASAVAAADLNGDGRVDAVSVGDGGLSVALSNRPAGSRFAHLGAPLIYAAPGALRHVLVTDLNLDGVPDVVAASTNAIVTLRGLGDGTFAAPVSVAAPATIQGIASGDFTGDGAPDVVLTSSNNTLTSLINNGQGVLGNPVNRTIGADPRLIAVADFNADNILDIALPNRGNARAQVLFGSGTGTFSGTSFAVASVPVAVAAGDVTGDGVPDLVVAHQGVAPSVAVYRNVAGVFSLLRTMPAPAPVVDVAVGNVDGVGPLDIIATTSAGQLLSVNGPISGTSQLFVSPTDFALGRLALGDFSGRGRSEPLATISAQAQVLISTPDDLGRFPAGAGAAGSAFTMTLNVPNAQAADLDPVIQLRAQFNAYRATLVGKTDAVVSRTTVPTLSARRGAQGTITINLRDWQGLAITQEVASLLLKPLTPAGARAAAVGTAISIAPGVYVVPVSVNAAPDPVAGTDQYEVVVTEAGGRTVTLMPRLLITVAACPGDFNGDGTAGTDADLEAFFACLAGNCCPTCGGADFNGDGDVGTDADIEAFFRVLAGGAC